MDKKPAPLKNTAGGVPKKKPPISPPKKEIPNKKVLVNNNTKKPKPAKKIEKVDKIDNEDSDSEKSDSGDEPIQKRGPGRPRINKPRAKIPRNGIVKKPTIYNSKTSPDLLPVVELVYENPIMFKKIFNLFKGMGSDSCNIIFEEKYVLIYTKDHLMKNTVYVMIYGDKMNSYYRGEPLSIKMSNTNIQKVLHTVNKVNGKITIYTTKQFKNKSLYMIIHDDELDADSVNEFEIDSVDIDQDIRNINELIEDEETYPVKMEIPFKAFKRKINELLQLSERVRFVKKGSSPLRIDFEFGNHRGNQRFRFSNSEKVNLRSTVPEDTVFSAPLNLSYIKPLAGSLITDSINISLDSQKGAIFTAMLDFDEIQGKKISGTEKSCIKTITQSVTN
jgi:hypothetical protein